MSSPVALDPQKVALALQSRFAVFREDPSYGIILLFHFGEENADLLGFHYKGFAENPGHFLDQTAFLIQGPSFEKVDFHDRHLGIPPYHGLGSLKMECHAFAGKASHRKRRSVNHG